MALLFHRRLPALACALALGLWVAAGVATGADAAGEGAAQPPAPVAATAPKATEAQVAILAALREAIARTVAHREGALQFTPPAHPIVLKIALQPQLRAVGEARLREATPDLLWLLANDIETKEVIPALRGIRDERAIIQLLCTATLNPDSDVRVEATLALLDIRAPAAPQIVLALRGADILHLRRGLLATRMMTRRRLEINLSAAEKARLTVSPELRDEVRRLLHHDDPHVRFEAAMTWLTMQPEDLATLKDTLGDDPDRSIQILLQEHGTVMERYSTPQRYPDSLRLEALRNDPARRVRPEPAAYRHQSDWVAIDRGLSARVAMTEVDLSLPPPIYELNPPVWLRMELRNDGAEPLTLRLNPATDRPDIYLGLADSVGRIHTLAYPDLIVDCFNGDCITTLTLAPGQVYSYAFNLVGDVQFQYNGRYTVRTPGNRGAVLLDLTVRDLPLPLVMGWTDEHWIGQSDPDQVMDRTFILTSDTRKSFGIPVSDALVVGSSNERYKPGHLLFAPTVVPAGPAAVYAEPPPLPPPDSPIHTPEAVVVVDSEGRQHRFSDSENGGWSLDDAKQRWVDPRHLQHLDHYFERVSDAAGHLRSIVFFRNGIVIRYRDYDAAGRLYLEFVFDRAGEPERGSRTLYDAEGRKRQVDYFRGMSVLLANSYTYAYDSQGRKTIEALYESRGMLSSYSVYHNDKREDGKIWREFFDATGILKLADWVDANRAR